MKSILLLLGSTALVGAASWQTDLDEAKRLSAAGQNAAAEAVYIRVLSNAEGLSATQLNALALQFHNLSRYRDAELLYGRSLAAWNKLGPSAAHDLVLTAFNLGNLLRIEGRYAEAETLLENCLQQAEASAGPNSPDTGLAASGLAAVYQAWGKLEDAESLASRANTIFERDVTRNDTAWFNNRRILGLVYIGQRRFDRAEAVLRPLLARPENRQTAAVYSDLASIALSQDRIAEAESLSLNALEAAKRFLPPAHPVRAAALNNLAQSYRFQGRFLEAEKCYRDAIAAFEESLGREHPETAKAAMNLAAFYHERGRETGAEVLYRRAAGIFDSAYGPQDPMTLVARNELADVFRAERRFTESEKLGCPSRTSLQALLGPKDPRVVRAMVNYARLLEDAGRSKRAAALRARKGSVVTPD